MNQHHEHARSPHQHLIAVRGLFDGRGVRGVTYVPTSLALGRRLAADVTAAEDSPGFDNSQMDGYALAGSHRAGGTFRVDRTIPAGSDPREILTGTAGAVGDAVVPVMTGARLPAGTEAVVPVETCDPPVFGAAEVTVPAAPAGQFLRFRGTDIRTGEVLFRAGDRVNPRTVGVAAAQGITTVPVHRAVRVVVCTGGDEITAGGGDGARVPGAATIRDANGPMLEALCRVHGIEVVGTVRTSDNPVAFRAALDDAVTKASPDAVVTSGGISHGAFEVVRQTLSQESESWFGHVAQQPGGPQGLARFRGVPVICLPGNPVSTAVSFRLFIAPVLGDAADPVTVELTTAVQGLPAKDCFLRARTENRAARLLATPVGGAGSHLLAQSVPADVLLRVPAGASLAAGDTVEAYPLD